MRRNFDPARREQLEEALFRLRRDGLTLEQICAIEGFPTRPTLRRWLREKPHLADVVAHGRGEFRRLRQHYPFDPQAAARLLERVRFREPISALIREPGMPCRRALTAWKRARPDFAADLEAAKDLADFNRRRYGRRRSTRRPYDEPTADRIILAVSRGMTLPQLYKDPTMPNRLALRGWRKAHPDFDGALRAAATVGHRARGRARVDAHCTPVLTEEIGERIAAGASLHSLSREPGMPSLYTLYKWVRDRPDFAEVVARACEFRNTLLQEEAFDPLMPNGFATDPEVNAIRKRLGQLNPAPGERRRGAREHG